MCQNAADFVTIFLISAGQLAVDGEDRTADTPRSLAGSDYVTSTQTISPSQATPQTGNMLCLHNGL